MMDAIRILRGCGASGVSLAAGTVYTVPGEVSERDADILVRLGKAEAVAAPAAPVEAEPAIGVEYGLPDVQNVPPMPRVGRPRKAKES